MLQNFGVRAKVVGQVLPRDWRTKQAVNEEDRNFIGIVRMDEVDASRELWTIRPDKRCEGASGHFPGVRIQYR